MSYDAIVIGGGLGGSASALRLARRGHRVLLVEKRELPAPKLCGEFLSPEVQASFDDMGVLHDVREAGAHPIERAFVTTRDGASFRSRLPGTALGLSRYALDQLLVEAAREAGAEVRDGTTVRGVAGSLAGGFRVQTRSDELAARLVVGAYGRRGLLDRKLGRGFLRQSAPRVAFKAHYEGRGVDDRVELHSFEGGYCGLSHVEEDRVNVCWIARQDALKAAGGTPEAMIRERLMQNPVLAERLGAMKRVSERFEAVSQVSFARKKLFENDVCMVGDAAAMIAPLCGDGMAMALQSAAHMAGPASAFLRATLPAASFRKQYETAWRSDFKRRLRIGRVAHRLLSVPALAWIGVRACQYVPGLARRLIRATRG